MPNRKTHLFAGMIVLIIVYFIFEYFHLVNSLYYAATIFIGSIIPDYIEPGTHWRHRKFFHSKTILKWVVITSALTFLIGLLPFIRFFWYITFFLLGYIIHLLMDWTTPAGLPE